MATLQVIVDILVHTWPEVALENAFFGLVQTVMSGEKVSVSTLENLRLQAVGQKDDHPTWLKLPFNSSPEDVVFHEAVVC